MTDYFRAGQGGRIGTRVFDRPEVSVAKKNVIGGAFNEVTARLKGLFPGAKKGAKKDAPQIDHSQNLNPTLDIEKDWRVRISVPPKSPFGDFAESFKDDLGQDVASVLAPLKNTNGVVFPYTPNIQISHSANYSPLSPTHSNYQSYFYNNSQVSSITITADFTAQNEEQARYVLAAIYFFRAATKMFYGQGANQGNPPPILYLDGYGSYYLPHVPVVVSNFSHSMPSDVDYISCNLYSSKVTSKKVMVDRPPVGGIGLGPQNFNPNAIYAGKDEASRADAERLKQLLTKESVTQVETKILTGQKQRIPTMSSVTIELLPMYSRRNVSENFSWEQFSRGELLKGKGGFL